MSRIFTYYSQYQSVQGRIGGLPLWGKVLVGLAVVPGILLLVLSMLALGVSILALSVLTIPVYRFVSVVAGNRAPASNETTSDGVRVEAPAEAVFNPFAAPPAARRQIDVRIVDEGEKSASGPA